MKISGSSIRKALIFIGLVLLFSLPALKAQAINLEAGAGQSRYDIVSNGTWYQTGVAGNHLQTNTRAFKVGLVGDYPLSAWSGVAAHADYVNMGHARAACDCTTVDADYDAATHSIKTRIANGLLQRQRTRARSEALHRTVFHPR